MQAKSEEHRIVLEDRLNHQDQRLDSMQKDLSALVGSGQITGLVQSIKESVDGGLAQQNAWHEADLMYRSNAEAIRTELLDRLGKVEGQIKFIRWFVATSKGVARTATGCFGLIQKAKLLEMLGIGILLMIS